MTAEPSQNQALVDWVASIAALTSPDTVHWCDGSDAEWGRLAGAIGNPELAADPRFATLQARKQNEDALEAIISAWTSERNSAEAEAILQAAGVAAAVCASNKSLAEDEHLIGRNFFVELEHPEVGVRKHAGIPWRMSDSESRVKSPAPAIGQHTEEVLRRVLGYDEAEVRKLSEAGALE